MANVYITSPAEYYPDPDRSRTLFNGQMYIGQPDLDPEIPANQIQVNALQENGSLVPVTQPISISPGGVPVDGNGDVYIRLIVDQNYSQKVLDSQGQQKYYIPNAFNGAPLTTNSDEIILKTDTVATLKALDLQAGQSIEADGYYSAGDGGGAKYLIQTAVEFGGTPDEYTDITLANGNIAVLQKGDILTAKEGGAAGDLYISGSLNPTPTDDRDAINAVKNKIKSSKTGESFDAQNLGYLFGDNVRFDQGDSGIKNIFISPAAGFTSSNIDDEDAVLSTKNGLRNTFDNLRLELGREANGIKNIDAGFYNRYSHIEINKFKDFGFQANGSGDQHLTHALITQESDVAERSVGGVGVDIQTGDFKLENCTIRYADIPLRVNGNTLLATGNHFYNGSAGSATPATNSTNILIEGGSGASFAHTYLDKGRVEVDNGGSVAFFDTKLLFNSTPEHNEIFRLKADTTTNKAFPDAFVYDGSTTTIPLTNGDMKFISFVTENGGSWSDEATSIKDEINLRYGGYPRIVQNEVCHVVAPNMTRISKGNRQSIRHSIGSLSYSENSNAGVVESYAPSEVQYSAGGLFHITNGSGSTTSATNQIEGSRTGSSAHATLTFKNRRGASTATDVDASLIRFQSLYRDASDDAMTLRFSSVGQNGDNALYVWNRDEYRPADDSTKNLGGPSNRWDTVYASNGTINTSDQNQKTDFEEIPVDWIDVLCSIADKVQIWKWKSAIESKGDDARKHIGPIAQEVYDSFGAIGVDAFEYGFVGKDKVIEQVIIGYDEDTGEDGNVIVDDNGETRKTPIYEERETGEEIWNLRHNELQYAIQWAQQQKINQLLNK